MTSPKHQVEALLFSSGKAMTVDQLSELSRLDKAKVKRALLALQKDYAARDSAVTVEGDGDTWKMSVTQEHLPLVKGIVAETELSRACMETLAVIAYRYPSVLQSEVIDTRGSGAYDHIKELEKLGFVAKVPSGRSYALKLTEKFFSYFEIEGEKDIRKMFKDVKPPERQQSLGELDVVEVEEKKEGPVGDMEVVDVEEQPEKPDAPPEKENKKEQVAFLDDLDKRIANISKRNDEHAEDPLLRQEPGGGDLGEREDEEMTPEK